MENKILFAWLGMTDIRASRGEEPAGQGPIAEAIAELGFERVVLLLNYPAENVAAYRKWLEARFSSLRVELHRTELSSPTEYAEIYENTVGVLEKFRRENPEAEFVYHLSPGTPAMAATWILIAGSMYPADLIESSLQRGVRRVSIPFEILAKYRPPKELEDQVISLSDQMLPRHPAFDTIIHKAGPLRKSLNKARRLAMFDNVPVLLLGESGTGKELFARAIYNASERSRSAFVPVNCGAIPEGMIESELFGHVKGAFTDAKEDRRGFITEADGGVLFLDEIADLPLPVQVKLLRVLHDKSFYRLGGSKQERSDFRLICATNKSLVTEVARGNFREDLYYRIAVGVVQLPPLRSRSEDLNLLIDHFLSRINANFAEIPDWKNKHLSLPGREVLFKHSWPGNIRELLNTLTRACVWSGGEELNEEIIRDAIIEPARADGSEDILHRDIGAGFSIDDVISEVERHYFQRALEETSDNKSRAAELLGLNNYQTLSNRLKKLGLH